MKLLSVAIGALLFFTVDSASAGRFEQYYNCVCKSYAGGDKKQALDGDTCKNGRTFINTPVAEATDDLEAGKSCLALKKECNPRKQEITKAFCKEQEAAEEGEEGDGSGSSQQPDAEG